MDTDTFMAIPAPTPADAVRAAGVRRARGPARALSTAFFSLATAFSRVAGLVREIVAASYFGISGPMSAFTIAFQVPNLVRSLFADAAIQAAFVPVFIEQLEQGDKREAFRLALDADLPGDAGPRARSRRSSSSRAPVLVPIFAPGFEGELLDLTVTLSQLLFPILILLGVDRDRGRGPQQLRPLRRLRDLAVLLERRDHRRAGRARAGVLRRTTGSTPTRSGSSSAP